MSTDFNFRFKDITTLRKLTPEELAAAGNVPESHVRLLEEYGVSRIDGGFIQFDYPPEMRDILADWNLDEEGYEIVGHTALGDYFVWTGEGFLMADTNNGELFDISSKPEFLYNYFLEDIDYLSKAHYRDMALEAIQENGTLAEDEVFAFTPYLIMGGFPQQGSLQKVKLKEHLSILGQLTVNG